MENNDFHAASAWSQYLPVAPTATRNMSSVTTLQDLDATIMTKMTETASLSSSNSARRTRRASCIANPPQIINSSKIYPYHASIPLTPPAEMQRNRSTTSFFDSTPPLSSDWLAELASGPSSQSKSTRGTTLSAPTPALSTPHSLTSRQRAKSGAMGFCQALSITIPPAGLECPLFPPSSFPPAPSLIPDYSSYASHEMRMQTSDTPSMEEVNAILGILPDPPALARHSTPILIPTQPTDPARYYPSPTSKGRGSLALDMGHLGNNEIDSRLYNSQQSYPHSAPAWQTSFPQSIHSPAPTQIASIQHSFPPSNYYPLALQPNPVYPRDPHRPRSAPTAPGTRLDRIHPLHITPIQHSPMLLDRRGSLGVPMPSYAVPQVQNVFPPSYRNSPFPHCPPLHSAFERRGSTPLPPSSTYHPSGRVTNRVPTGGISFVNFTSVDADALLAGVAPSGSSKRKREAEGELMVEKLRRGRRVYTV